MKFNSFILEENDKIKIIVLTSHTEKGSDEDVFYVVDRIREECEKRKQECYILFSEDSRVETDKSGITKIFSLDYPKGIVLDKTNTVVFARGNFIRTRACLDILSQIENTGVFCINERLTIEQCAEKFRTTTCLYDAGIPTPKTALVSNLDGLKIAFEKIGEKFPVVLKTMTGSKGIGVSIVRDWAGLKSTLQTIWKLDDECEMIIQEYIDVEYDIRTHVLGNKVIAAMKRYRIKDDFRSNFSLGGEIEKIELDDEQTELALRGNAAVGGVWTAVDLMKGPDGYMIIEINSSPGTEGIEKAEAKSVVGIVLDYINDKSNWKKKMKECGFAEKIKVIGIGEMVAKMDTGNSNYCTIHADDYEIDGDEVKWTHHGKSFTHEIESFKETSTGNIDKHEHKRPVIRLDVEYDGETYKDIRFILADREGPLGDALMNRAFLRRANLVVNPWKRCELKIDLKEQGIVSTRKTITANGSRTSSTKINAINKGNNNQRKVGTINPPTQVNKPKVSKAPVKKLSPKEKKMEELKRKGWVFLGHGVWRDSAGKQKGRLSEDGTWEIIEPKKGEIDKTKSGVENALTGTQKKIEIKKGKENGKEGEEPPKEKHELLGAERIFSPELEKKAIKIASDVGEELDIIHHIGKIVKGSFGEKATIEMTKHVLDAIENGERNMDTLAMEVYKGYSKAVDDYYGNEIEDDLPKQLLDDINKKQEQIKASRDTSYIPEVASDIKKLKEEDVLKQGNLDEYRETIEKNLQEVRGEDTETPEYHEIMGKISDDNELVSTITKNMENELASYDSYLHESAKKPAQQFISSYKNIIEQGIKDGSLKDIDAEDINKLAVDCMKKLMHQEKEAIRVDYTDHGFRHIVGNMERQNNIHKLLDKNVSGKEQLMGLFIMANHDMGYSSPVGREGGNRGGVFSGMYHKKISAHLSEQQRGEWNENKIFTPEEYDVINEIIEKHDDTTLGDIPPQYSNLANSIKIADNLSMYNNEKLPGLFKYTKNGEKNLLKLGEIVNKIKDKEDKGKLSEDDEDVKAFENQKKQMLDDMEKDESIDPRLKRDLKVGINNIRYDTPKYTLGVLSGRIDKISKMDDGKINVVIKHNKLDYAVRNIHPDKISELKARKFFEDSGYTKDEAFDGSKTEFDLGKGPKGEGKNILHVSLIGAPKSTKLQRKEKIKSITVKDVMKEQEVVSTTQKTNTTNKNKTSAKEKQVDMKKLSPKEKKMAELKKKGWIFLGHGVWRDSAGNQKGRLSDDGTWEIIEPNTSETEKNISGVEKALTGTKKQTDTADKKSIEKKNIEPPKEKHELLGAIKIFSPELEKKAIKIASDVAKELNAIHHVGEFKSDSFGEKAAIEMTKNVLDAINKGERNMDILANEVHRGFSKAVDDHYGNEIEDDLPKQLLDDKDNKKTDIKKDETPDDITEKHEYNDNETKEIAKLIYTSDDYHYNDFFNETSEKQIKLATEKILKDTRDYKFDLPYLRRRAKIKNFAENGNTLAKDILDNLTKHWSDIGKPETKEDIKKQITILIDDKQTEFNDRKKLIRELDKEDDEKETDDIVSKDHKLLKNLFNPEQLHIRDHKTESVQKAISSITLLPKETLKKLSENNVDIYVGARDITKQNNMRTNANNNFQETLGRDNKKRIRNYNDVGGVYEIKNLCVVVNSNDFPDETVLHEIGHSIYHTILNKEDYNELLIINTKYKDILGDYYYRSNNRDLGCNEMFSQTFALMTLMHNEMGEPDDLIADMSTCKDFEETEYSEEEYYNKRDDFLDEMKKFMEKRNLFNNESW